MDELSLKLTIGLMSGLILILDTILKMYVSPRPTTYLISAVILIILIVYRLLSEKKKYENPTYLKNLQIINEFLAMVRLLNDYVTWVQRDRIKSEYAIAGKFFKNKTNYYKKETAVKNFNEIFEDFDNYII